MIPNHNPNIIAVFGEADETETYPVVAWDDDGSALIVYPDSDKLVQAHEVEGFRHLDPGHPVSLLPVPPGAYVTRGGGAPVVGFVVDREGINEPLILHEGRLVLSGSLVVPASTPDASVTPIRGAKPPAGGADL